MNGLSPILKLTIVFVGNVPIVTPKFSAGDMLIFDHWLLHRTHRDRSMTDYRVRNRGVVFFEVGIPSRTNAVGGVITKIRVLMIQVLKAVRLSLQQRGAIE